MGIRTIGAWHSGQPAANTGAHLLQNEEHTNSDPCRIPDPHVIFPGPKPYQQIKAVEVLSY
jgi:hypothetical protein